MNKPLSFFIFVFLITTNTFAQSTEPTTGSKFKAGLVTGINISSFTQAIGEFGYRQKDSYSSYPRIGTLLGMHCRYQISDLIALKTELIFNGRGGAYRTENNDVITFGNNGNDKSYYLKNYRLNYLEIPFLIEFGSLKLDKAKQAELRFGGGLSYGLLTSSSLRYNGFSPVGSSSEAFVPVKEDYTVTSFNHGKKSISNYLFDLTCNYIHNNKIPLFARIRYMASFEPVYNKDVLYRDNMKTHMNTWSIALGVYFTNVQ